jgi:mono/diheme cytochrome c family protein
MVRRLCVAVVFAGAMALAGSAAVRALHAAGQTPPAQPNPDSWQIPPKAAEEQNPIAPGDKVMAKGKQIYASKCERCHGPAGKGDGHDADPDHMPEDLTDPQRASRNPDGVIFYKVWNGRKKPKMPAFKTEMTRKRSGPSCTT